MIRWTYSYFNRLPPIPSTYIDGCLYVFIAFFGAVATLLGSDEAAKWIPPAALFWSRGVCSVCAAVALAIKMYRSTGFADHKAAVKQQGDTQIFVKPEETKTP